MCAESSLITQSTVQRKNTMAVHDPRPFHIRIHTFTEIVGHISFSYGMINER